MIFVRSWQRENLSYMFCPLSLPFLLLLEGGGENSLQGGAAILFFANPGTFPTWGFRQKTIMVNQIAWIVGSSVFLGAASPRFVQRWQPGGITPRGGGRLLVEFHGLCFGWVGSGRGGLFFFRSAWANPPPRHCSTQKKNKTGSGAIFGGAPVRFESPPAQKMGEKKGRGQPNLWGSGRAFHPSTKLANVFPGHGGQVGRPRLRFVVVRFFCAVGKNKKATMG